MEPQDRRAGRMRPTLRTIAQATGLAVATVSRALSDAPDLRADTKARVRCVADELGYVPDRAALRLRTGRTQVIALVIGTEPDVMSNTARLIRAVAVALRPTRFHLNVTPVLPDEEPLRPIRHIVENALADAVIFNQTRPRDPRAAWLLARGFPFATHGRTAWADRHPWADFDTFAFGALGLRRLARRGRRHIALLAPPLGQFYGREFVRGARAAAAEAGAAVALLPRVTSDSPAPAVRAAVARALGDGIDGLLSCSSFATLAAVDAIEAAGLRLGRQIDVVAKEAEPFLSAVRPDLLMVRENVDRAGTVLAQAAIRAITEPESPPLQDLEVPGDGHSEEPRA